jgi:AcrR family transcriptional regulator
MTERTTPRTARVGGGRGAPSGDVPSDPGAGDAVTSAAANGTRREQILDAALQSFGTRGYEATSLDQLAVELGVRKQTILYYEPS